MKRLPATGSIRTSGDFNVTSGASLSICKAVIPLVA
jgi:hypothetical protein